MEDQITLEEALRLVYFEKYKGEWHVDTVRGDCRFVEGDCNAVMGNCGAVEGDCNEIYGTVKTTIKGRKWQFIETPAEKLERLIVSNSNLQSEMKDEMIKTLNEIIN